MSSSWPTLQRGQRRWDSLAAPPSAHCRQAQDSPLVVALPARDEEKRIARTLRALGGQLHQQAGSFRVLVLANNCTDRTAAEARAAARLLPIPVEVVEEWFPAAQAHVGHARGRALELAAALLAGHPGGLLATTDADTVVAPDWAAQTRQALSRADVVGGRIYTLPEERGRLPGSLRRLQLQDAAYHLLGSELASRLDPDPADPWPRHHQHFGASLALRLSAWQEVKVWPQVRCLEDMALVQELRRLDLRIRHCPQVQAWTSARQSGRVEVGLSSQLREWKHLQAHGQAWLVPGADELRAAAEASAALGRSWRAGRAVAGLEPNGLEATWMVEKGALKTALEAPTLGLARELALHARWAEGRWADAYPAVALETALRGLRSLLGQVPQSG